MLEPERLFVNACEPDRLTDKAKGTVESLVQNGYFATLAALMLVRFAELPVIPWKDCPEITHGFDAVPPPVTVRAAAPWIGRLW
ncbi:MAG: hypothetical protein ACKOJF_14490, partial [Planctomycetaceae bacterium]